MRFKARNITSSNLDSESGGQDVVVEAAGDQVLVKCCNKQQALHSIPSAIAKVFRVSPNTSILAVDSDIELCISLSSDDDKLHGALARLFDNKASSSTVFERKTDKGSADLYFKYYGALQHQQNMLQDYVRTGLYHSAITQNSVDFQGKVVMDVGAGSGILSLFSAQAGARRVYAVEASGMAKFAQQLAAANPSIGKVIQVKHSTVEALQLDEKADVLVSEPMGTLLVNERMLETYIYARDHFLKPGGKMFPQVGRIHAAAFSDEMLYNEIATKATFWQQNSFYGVDVTCLYQQAQDSYLAQVVVDAMDPAVLVSSCATHVIDLATCSEKDLHDFTIPLDLQVTAQGPCVIHGIATWFDVLFPGSQMPVWLTTAPGMPTTHWFQLRCVLAQPIYLPGPGHKITGHLRLIAHRHQSYDVHLMMEGPPRVLGGPPQKSSGVFDLKEPYYRQLTAAGWYSTATAGTQQADQVHQQAVQPQATQQMYTGAQQHVDYQQQMTTGNAYAGHVAQYQPHVANVGSDQQHMQAVHVLQPGALLQPASVMHPASTSALHMMR